MYYLMEVDDFVKPRPYRTRYEPPDRAFQPTAWIKGEAITMPKSGALRFDLWEYQPGHNGLPEILLDTVPLFREDVLATLGETGVDNLQTCAAVLQDPKKGAIKNYRAVNIVGSIRCADLERSKYHDVTGTGLTAMNFRKLVIDEAKAGGALLFRLAESVDSIIVHSKVREALAARPFRYLQMRPLG